MKRLILWVSFFMFMSANSKVFAVENNGSQIIKVKNVFQDIGYEEGFKDIDRVLKINLKKLIESTFLSDKFGSELKEIEKIEFKICKTNLYNDDNSDILIKVKITATEWKSNTCIIFGFIYKDGNYVLTFKDIGWNKSFDIEPKLIDIDSDGKYEIVIEADSSGNQSSALFVTIYKLVTDKYIPVFEEGLDECYASFPYSYTNKYYFVKNKTKSKSKLIDIVYNIKTHFESYNPKTDNGKDISYYNKIYEKYGNEIFRPFKGEYVFTFDGSKYVCNKEMYDYRKYLIQFLNTKP
ncbi:MAG: hypothetical protein PHE88_08970 [Elusimicrobia bacterium]|nr:hypothetical protein [Elusimicrobiota bacterium]